MTNLPYHAEGQTGRRGRSPQEGPLARILRLGRGAAHRTPRTAPLHFLWIWKRSGKDSVWLPARIACKYRHVALAA